MNYRMLAWVLCVFCGLSVGAGAGADGMGAVAAAEAGVSAQVAEAGRARLSELRREIARHDELYFRKNAPVISDDEYDRLKRELRDLEARFGDREDDAADSVGGAGGGSLAVGDDRSGVFETRLHRAPMGSLAKVYSDEELGAFHARMAARLGHEDVVYRVEPKYDGLAVSLTYENGRLVRALTRGDGREGEDITAELRARAAGVVEELVGGWVPELCELRGELFLSWSEFGRINAEREAAGAEVFSHPRTLAVGLVRRRAETDAPGEWAADAASAAASGAAGDGGPDADGAGDADARGVGEAERSLSLVVYAWGAWEPAGSRPETLREFRERLAAWRLPVVAEARGAVGGDELRAAVAEMRGAGARGGFPTDGVVVKLERRADQEMLGLGTEGPRWAVARKFPAERVASRLLGVSWRVGRTGVLTPVAELAPVELGGATVTRASLHNAEELARRDLRVGDWVWVEKAGEIIPQIAGVDLARREAGNLAPVPPTRCPGCAAPVRRGAAEGEGAAAGTEEGAKAAAGAVARMGAGDLRCVNAGCPERLARRLEHYASPAGMGLKGLGPSLVEALVKSGRVRTPADLYRLREADTESGLRSLPQVGGRFAGRLMREIEESRARAASDGARFLSALGLPGVGPGTARRLADAFPGLAELSAADEAALRRVSAEGGPGLGAVAARDLAEYLRGPLWREECASWLASGVGASWRGGGAPRGGGGPLAGKTVVLTGSLGPWSRAEATEKLRGAGATVRDRVTGETDLLVVGEEPGAKLAEARKRGIEVIDEAELMKRLGVDEADQEPDGTRDRDARTR